MKDNGIGRLSGIERNFSVSVIVKVFILQTFLEGFS